jgi:tRNA(Ile)-lysidine synthase
LQIVAIINLQEDFNSVFTKEQRQKPCFIACSGGADSMVLAFLAKNCFAQLTLLHVNYQLRGTESNRDEEWVVKTAKNWGINCSVTHFNTKQYADDNKLGIQEAARVLRYNWFSKQMDASQQSCILLTGHQANDNRETYLFNALRGSTVKGLTGIPNHKQLGSHQIFRPLLKIDRQTIETFAAQEKIPYIIDSSNLKTDYTRNFLRLDLLPALAKEFEHLNEKIDASIDRNKQFAQVYDFGLEHLTKQIEKKVIGKRKLEKAVGLCIPELEKLPDALLQAYFVSKGFTEKQFIEIKKLQSAQNNAYINNIELTAQLVKQNNWFLLQPTTPSQPEEQQIILIDSNTKQVDLKGHKLSIEIIKAPIKLNVPKHQACIAFNQIEWPLCLRTAQEGDYFYPLGMAKKKKLSRFFIDEKIPLAERKNMQVITSNKKIIWVLGHRMDDRFKVNPNTQQVLMLSLV